MADFADLVFTVDTSDLVKSEKFIRNVIASAEKMGMTVERVNRKAETSTQKSTKASREAEAQARREAAAKVKAAKDAETAAKREAAEKQRAAKQSEAAVRRAVTEQERQVRAYQNLRATIDPAYRATLQYEQSVESLNNALRMGMITQQEHIRLLGLAEAQTIGAGQANDILSNSLMRFGLQSRQARANVQQLSYQIQDVFITLQAGQPLMIILAQQGSQIASIFGPKGAIAGAAISLAALFGMGLTSALGGAKEEAISSETVYGELSATTRELEQASLALSNAFEAQRRGMSNLNTTALDYLQTLEGVRRVAQDEQLKASLNAFGAGQADFPGASESSGLGEIVERFGPGSDFARAFDASRAPGEFLGLTIEQALRLQEILAQISGETAYDLALSFAEATSELQTQGLLTDEVAAELNKIAEAMDFVNALQEEQINAPLVAWQQYYQSRVTGQQFLANQQAAANAAALAGWNQYYQSRVAGQQFLANQQATTNTAALAGWQQYYQSRVAGQQFLANQEAAQAAAALAGWSQYYQSRIVGEEFLARSIQAQTDALARQYEFLARSRRESQNQLEAAQRLLTTYSEQAELSALIAEYGEGSTQVIEARVRQEMRSVDAQLALLDVAESLKGEIRLAAEEMFRLRYAGDEAETEVLALSTASQLVYGHLNDAKTALELIRALEPAEGWLSGAISAASALASNLWNAASANAALMQAGPMGGARPTGEGSSSGSGNPNIWGGPSIPERPIFFDSYLPDLTEGVSSAGGAAEDAADSFEDMRKAFDGLMGSLDPAIAAQQKFAENTKIVEDAFDAGVISAEEYLAATDKIAKQLEEDLSGESTGYASLFEQGMQDMRSAIRDLAEGGFKDFESFTDSLVSSFSSAIEKMVAEAATAQLGNSLGSSLGFMAGPIGGIVGSLAGGLFGGLFGSNSVPYEQTEQYDIDQERLKLSLEYHELMGHESYLRKRQLQEYDKSNRALAREVMALQEKAAIDAEAATLQQRLWQLEGNTAALRQAELETLHPSNQALQTRIWALEDEAAIAAEAAGLQQQIWQLEGNTAALREAELAKLDESNQALQIRIWALEDEAAIAAERASLEQQLLTLQGDTAALRALEIQALDASNQALQEEIWALEDATAIANERASLEEQLLTLQGDTAALRELELAKLDASNQALQLRIWALEDEAAIAAEAAGLQQQIWQLEGNTAALREAELAKLDASNQALQLRIWALEDEAAIAAERADLEKQLLVLQGDTAALRALELEALDESNRALQLQIWALEDLKKALDDIQPEDYRTLVDYNRALAQAQAGIYVAPSPATLSSGATVYPTPYVPMPSATAGSTTDTALLNEVKSLREEQLQLGIRIDRSTKRVSDFIVAWDTVGLPPERVS